jgi:hypothetical protein
VRREVTSETIIRLRGRGGPQSETRCCSAVPRRVSSKATNKGSDGASVSASGGVDVLLGPSLMLSSATCDSPQWRSKPVTHV